MTEEQEFNPSQIKWIKSVTRDKGKAWAYLDVNVGDTFPLNFSKNPKWYPTNYLIAKPREIIALFQTLETTDTLPGGWYVTHLVTPVDEIISKEDNGSHPYVRLVSVIAIDPNPKLIDSIVWSFYKCNRGQICNIKTIEQRTNLNQSIEQKQKFIWGLFKNIDKGLFKNIPNLTIEPEDIDDYVATEGKERTILKLHKFRERDITVIKKAKANAKREKRLFCEVCLFNFENQYPILGVDFIECHHKQPISQGGIRETRVEDLAIVCANCHRMLHRKNIDGNYLTVDELGRIIHKKMN
ncbi:HNH endonuclease [Flavihumibacter profundi]|uniref:HNH endonuclease n=1 Tax=Flavihumibacter profundi TaxID=2716883 RepID=UPI001CC614AD|nr:HNH endonuclease [Flavihumibacter profundi]MBZ5857396.1 HNH endonuclease [Flavihumibacter profundi]